MTGFLEIQNSLPEEYPDNLKSINRKEFLSRDLTIIVLDDDPTGTQTIYDVPVLTDWTEKEILKELNAKTSLFFILTNSRSLTSKEADNLALEIGKNIKKASARSGRETIVISRSDSTLRGHYPNEVEALGKGLGIEESPQILIPAFFQGGRYTINDIHYVREGDNLIPAGETIYAGDSTFGYKSSNLKNYIEEKTGGSIKAEQVVSIGIDDIRKLGPSGVKKRLDSLSDGKVCIVNAFSQRDLDVFVAGYYEWQDTFKPVLFRTAASIVPSMAGVEVQAPLEKITTTLNSKGGLIVVGSYVSTTSKQLEYLKQNYVAKYVEINATQLINKKRFNAEVNRVSHIINKKLEKDEVIVVYTSRRLIKGNTPGESLRIVNQISKGLVEVMKGIRIRPKFVIAKGGITSSDIATKSFQIKRAQVLGQIIPGVPLWRLDDCPQFPELIYMPFPGNLGGDDSVFRAIEKLI